MNVEWSFDFLLLSSVSTFHAMKSCSSQDFKKAKLNRRSLFNSPSNDKPVSSLLGQISSSLKVD